MRYTYGYFREGMPAWKRKKDPPLSRIFYRPAGFVLAAVCANLGISANTVSYFSAAEAVAACLLFLPDSQACRIAGAVLVNLWLALDCTDGCLARSVKKQPFGEFADGISSYILVALLGGALGIAVFREGGLLVGPGCVWMVLAGAAASTADTLMRLIYQKYRATERELADAGILESEKDARTDHSQVGSLRVKIEQDLGIGGILPLFVLLGTIFHALDLVVGYMLLYYGGSCLAVTALYIRKAVRAVKVWEEKEAKEPEHER